MIDLFAGPGGLGEGFTAFRDKASRPVFRIALSVEKDPIACETLKLRSFFRQFSTSQTPNEYYDYMRGRICKEELYCRHPKQHKRAEEEVWNAELGNDRLFPFSEVNTRIRGSLGAANKHWVLIGGPPCQAYSIAGRSRVIPVDRREGTSVYENDKRHFLYRAYLRVLAEHRPSVFVLENVKGILSAEVGGKRIIDRLLSDLQRPSKAWRGEESSRPEGVEYDIHPIAEYGGRSQAELLPSPRDFIVRSEEHGIPQARHRLILVGVRKDVGIKPGKLALSRDKVSMWSAIGELPKLRSRTKNGQPWAATIRSIMTPSLANDSSVEPRMLNAIKNELRRLSDDLTTGDTFLACEVRSAFEAEWFNDPRIGGVCHHMARGHMDSDLWRYFFGACYAQLKGKSPTLDDFPRALLPNHKNLKKQKGETVFKDRFRVQVKNSPASTITSHISKDGHYFIHPDPLQCRSLTVREAARLQTFPDNYVFAGGPTQQYQQVGNAVPPLLAKKIAAIV
ncbi:MAG: DNA cytosine methyltransferase, partial [Terriglobales bacterium]